MQTATTKQRERSLEITRARELRNNPTLPEKVLWHHLRNRQLKGLKFRRQCPLGAYIADFACLSARLIVEVDGAQHAEPAQARHDRIRTVWLKGQDFRVLRFWNAEVLRDLAMVLATIEHEAMNPAPSPRPQGAGEVQG